MNRHGQAEDAWRLRRLEQALSSKRFQHVRAVADLAAAAASRFSVSPRQAWLAGMFHDCARDLSPEALQKILSHYRGGFAPPATRAVPALWHNPAGIVLARERYQINDTKVLRAIGIHSTGRPGMNDLDRLIYVSDFCEPGRTHAAARDVRMILEKSLSDAVRRVTREKTAYLRSHYQPIHPWTLALAREQGIRI